MSNSLLNKNIDLLPGIVQILDEAKDKIQQLTGTKVFIKISENPAELNVDTLQYLVCKEFNTSWNKIKSSDRHHNLVDARSVYSFLSHSILKKSKVEIAAQLNRHHSSIIHLIDRTKDLIEVNDRRIVPIIYKIEKTIQLNYERA